MPRYDLDAFTAEARAKYEPFEFTIGGEEFTFPSPADLEWKARILLATDGERGLRLMLGDEEYQRLIRTKPSDAAMTKLMQDYGKYIGGTPGEASGSTPS